MIFIKVKNMDYDLIVIGSGFVGFVVGYYVL